MPRMALALTESREETAETDSSDHISRQPDAITSDEQPAARWSSTARFGRDVKESARGSRVIYDRHARVLSAVCVLIQVVTAVHTLVLPPSFSFSS